MSRRLLHHHYKVQAKEAGDIWSSVQGEFTDVYKAKLRKIELEDTYPSEEFRIVVIESIETVIG